MTCSAIYSGRSSEPWRPPEDARPFLLRPNGGTKCSDTSKMNSHEPAKARIEKMLGGFWPNRQHNPGYQVTYVVRAHSFDGQELRQPPARRARWTWRSGTVSRYC